MATPFTGIPGVFVEIGDTIAGFKAILSGEMDSYPEAAFMNVGTIAEVIEKAGKREMKANK